jgi:phosphatidylglycerophosphatase A
VASSGYLGLIPQRLWGTDSGAGTFGAAVGTGIGALLLAMGSPWWGTLVAAALAVALSLWAAAPFSADHGDPGWVCIDETAGSLVALVGLTTWWPFGVAALVARLTDIFKVLPGVALAERSLPGSIGVTADDVVAGLYGLGAGWALVALL